MQKTTPAPTPPSPPATTVEQPSQPVAVDVGNGQLIQVPRTRAEYEAIQAQRSELSSQLQSAIRRREQTQRQLLISQGADRAGLEQHLAVLDTRIAQLETDIAVTGRALTNAPTSVLVQSHDRIMGMGPDAFAPLMAIFIIFVLGPMSIGIARTLWKRAGAPPPTRNQEEMARLERIEQAVDAIAIEVERVSESQRFATRILSENRGAPALGPAQAAAEPLRVRELEPVAARRQAPEG